MPCENIVLDEVLPDYLDVWSTLKPDEEGYTFDGTINTVCCYDR